MDYDKDTFADITSRDPRYSARAYTVLMNVIDFLGHEGTHFSAEDIMEDFRDFVLDEFGPLSFHVLREWGVTRCEDLGEMMFNLSESGRVKRDDEDSRQSFTGGYDFTEAFALPFEPRK